METTTIASIIIGTTGILIVSMAGLIKTMVVSKLEHLQHTIDELGSKHQELEVRVTRLEVEHRMRGCAFHAPEPK